MFFVTAFVLLLFFWQRRFCPFNLRPISTQGSKETDSNNLICTLIHWSSHYNTLALHWTQRWMQKTLAQHEHLKCIAYTIHAHQFRFNFNALETKRRGHSPQKTTRTFTTKATLNPPTHALFHPGRVIRSTERLAVVSTPRTVSPWAGGGRGSGGRGGGSGGEGWGGIEVNGGGKRKDGEKKRDTEGECRVEKQVWRGEVGK